MSYLKIIESKIIELMDYEGNKGIGKYLKIYSLNIYIFAGLKYAEMTVSNGLS